MSTKYLHNCCGRKLLSNEHIFSPWNFVLKKNNVHVLPQFNNIKIRKLLELKTACK